MGKKRTSPLAGLAWGGFILLHPLPRPGGSPSPADEDAFACQAPQVRQQSRLGSGQLGRPNAEKQRGEERSEVKSSGSGGHGGHRFYRCFMINLVLTREPWKKFEVALHGEPEAIFEKSNRQIPNFKNI